MNWSSKWTPIKCYKYDCVHKKCFLLLFIYFIYCIYELCVIDSLVMRSVFLHKYLEEAIETSHPSWHRHVNDRNTITKTKSSPLSKQALKHCQEIWALGWTVRTLASFQLQGNPGTWINHSTTSEYYNEKLRMVCINLAFNLNRRYSSLKMLLLYLSGNNI